MHVRFISETHARTGLVGTDARIHKGHFDIYTQRSFGQRMRARYEVNPGCAQPTSRTTILTIKAKTSDPKQIPRIQ